MCAPRSSRLPRRAGAVLLSASALCVALAAIAAAEPVAVAGRVAEVTLYRGQAQVVRVIPLDVEPGAVELVVTDLPPQVVPASLAAETSPGVEVRAVRYRGRAVGQEPREEVQNLDAQIEALEDRIQLNDQTRQLLDRRQAHLDQLEGFVAPAAQGDLARGVLDATALERVTEFAFAQREAAVARVTELRAEQRRLERELELLRRQRAELAGRSARVAHEALLFLEKRAAGAESVRLSYLVGDCGWSPAYNFRGDTAAGTVRIEYNALIQQMSGEDWTDVALTLSTASPALSAAGLALAPFQVTLAAGPQPESQPQPQQVRAKLQLIVGGQQKALASNAMAVEQRANLDANWSLNRLSSDAQILELDESLDALRAVRADPQLGRDEPSLTYPLPDKVSLASRRDQQMVRIVQSDLASQFYYAATPVLAAHVYREAQLANSSDQDLLNGTVSVYLDGRFVGRTEIGTVARGQTFVVGFGADPQLRASRELLERQRSIQGGNQVLAFRHRIMIENYKDVEVPVRVYDRIPWAGLSTDVRVTVGDMSDPLSEDPQYLRLDRPKGILRWDLSVGPHAAGEGARIVEHAHRLEFDRNSHLGLPSGTDAEAAQQQEFESLQNQRQRY